MGTAAVHGIALITGLIMVGAAAPAAAACPPDCPLKLGIETTLKLEDGNTIKESRAVALYDVSSFDLVGSRATLKLGLETPIDFGDANAELSRWTMTARLYWQPADWLTPASTEVQIGPAALPSLLHVDPRDEGRPSLRLVLPRPLQWHYLPAPFVEGDGRDFRAGLRWGFLASAGTLPGATRFTIDSVRIDARFAAVPEPASWLSLLAGLGSVGLVLRQRRPLSA